MRRMSSKLLKGQKFAFASVLFIIGFLASRIVFEAEHDQSAYLVKVNHQRERYQQIPSPDIKKPLSVPELDLKIEMIKMLQMYGLPAESKAFLREQSTNIVNELKIRKVTNSQAKKMIPLLGGTPKRLILLAGWRTGSTFVSELIGSALNNVRYFNYEPLLPRLRVHAVENTAEEFKAINLLKTMMKCQYDQVADERDYIMNVVFKRNPGLFAEMWRSPSTKKKLDRYIMLTSAIAIKENNQSHHVPLDELQNARNLVQAYCSLHPYQVIKSVRLKLRTMERILSDAGMNSQILLLIRDPRATLHSRSQLPWCTKNKQCYTPQVVCQNMLEDYVSLKNLNDLFPGRVKAVRFEDMAMNVSGYSNRLLKYISVAETPFYNNYVKGHTQPKRSNSAADSTVKISTQVAFNWIKKRSKNDHSISDIEESCKEAMEVWGYLPLSKSQGQDPINKAWLTQNSHLTL